MMARGQTPPACRPLATRRGRGRRPRRRWGCGHLSLHPTPASPALSCPEDGPRPSPTTLSLGRAATTPCRGTVCPHRRFISVPLGPSRSPARPLPFLPPHASLMDKHECYAKRVQPPSRAGLLNRRYYIDLSACKKRVLR